MNFLALLDSGKIFLGLQSFTDCGIGYITRVTSHRDTKISIIRYKFLVNKINYGL